MALPSITIDSFRSYLLAMKSPATAHKYASGAERFLAFLARNRLVVENLPPGILSHFAENMIHEGLKASSVAVYVAAARKFLEWLRAHGQTNLPNLARVDLPKVEHQLPNSLKQSDLLILLSAASKLQEPIRSALLLMPFCGLRAHELCTLTLDSISKVSVPAQPGAPSAGTYVCFTVRGKGGKVRTVPLLLDGTPLLVSYLGNWRRRVSGKWLFPSPSLGGRPISERTLRWHTHKIHKRLPQVKRLTTHTLRRTYLTTLHRAGLDIPTLTRIAGHESVQTTMKHYLEIRPEDMTGAVHRTGARLVPTGPYAATVEKAGATVHELLERIRKGE